MREGGCGPPSRRRGSPGCPRRSGGSSATCSPWTLPDHTRLRTLVHKAFTPRLIENMQERIRSLADELLDAVEARGRMDVIRDFALPLPTTIIAEMLGVPARDRSRFHRWSNALVSSTSSLWGTLKTLPHVMAFLRYIGKLVKARQAAPKEDLASALVMAHEAGDRLSEDELVAMIFLLLVAGHETTVNLIGNGVLALLEHTGQMERLRDDPGLIRPAVEEFLRYDPPVHLASERYAREDVTLGGVTIARSEMVHPLLGSANRDELQFVRPDDLDIAREPNRHVAFGQGVHYCLGAALARMEGQIAVNTLLRRMPELRLAVPRHALRRARHGAARPGGAAGGVFPAPCPRASGRGLERSRPYHRHRSHNPNIHNICAFIIRCSRSPKRGPGIPPSLASPERASVSSDRMQFTPNALGVRKPKGAGTKKR